MLEAVTVTVTVTWVVVVTVVGAGQLVVPDPTELAGRLGRLATEEGP